MNRITRSVADHMRIYLVRQAHSPYIYENEIRVGQLRADEQTVLAERDAMPSCIQSTKRNDEMSIDRFENYSGKSEGDSPVLSESNSCNEQIQTLTHTI